MPFGAGGVFSAVGRCLTEPPPLRKGRLQGQGDGACLRRRTLVGARLDLPDSSSSVPLILRWVALILPRAQALRERRGRVGGRRVWDGAGSGRLGWGRSSIIQIYTPASFENRTQRGSSREKARNPAESLALARLHPRRRSSSRGSAGWGCASFIGTPPGRVVTLVVLIRLPH